MFGAEAALWFIFEDRLFAHMLLRLSQHWLTQVSNGHDLLLTCQLLL